MRPALAFTALLASLAACEGGTPAPPRDAASRADAPADGPTLDARVDGGTADVAGDGAADDVPPAPYDAGPAPPCTVAAFTRHVAGQDPAAEAVEPGGVVPVEGGFLVIARQGASRLAGADAGARRRDTVDVFAVTEAGTLRGPPMAVYDSTPAGTDLSLPALVRAGRGALAFFRESRGLQTATAFVTELRGLLLGPAGARQGAEVTLPDRGDGFAAALPDGTILVIASRVLQRTDGGFVVATPNAVRVRPDGTAVDPRGVDLGGVVPINADSVLMRPSPSGAALVFRVGTDVQVVRFDAQGTVDTRPYLTRGIDATRLDDAAVLAEGTVLGWDEPAGASHAIHVAVLDPESRLVRHSVVDRFDSASAPVVAVTPVHGGAAVTWLRGSGATAALRGTVMQPNGVTRWPVRELLPVPYADGRMLATGEGRALAFVARDRVDGAAGLTFGRLCLPE